MKKILLILFILGAAYMLVNVVEIYEYFCDKILKWLQKDKWF